MTQRDTLAQQVAAIAARLERVEQKLGLAAEPQQTSVPPKADAKSQVARRLLSPELPHAAKSTSPPADPTPSTIPPTSPDSPTLTTPPTIPQKPSPVAPSPPQTRTPTLSENAERRRFSLEMFLGGKTTAWVGAIIVVLGSAFAIREFGTGFWSALPDGIKLLAIAMFAIGLLGMGELAYRRIGRAASVGLFSAGLGVLYLDAYASHQWFSPPVVTQEVAFILMASVAAVAFSITVRTRSLTIGVLSLIGGYLTPLLLGDGGGQPLPVMVYLTVLAGVALALAARMSQYFHSLRFVALGGHMMLGLVVILAYGSTHWEMMLVFSAIWWTMFMSEAVLSALRDRSPIGNVVSTLIATTAFVTVGGWVLAAFAPPVGLDWLGIFVLMIATLSATTALHFGPGLDTLRGRLNSAMDKLAIALWAQCGVLLTLAIALQFDGYGATIGWLALAVASVEIGRRLPSRGMSIFGLVLGSMAIFRLVTLDQFSASLQMELLAWHGVTVDGLAVLSLAAVTAIHVAAQRIGPLSRTSVTSRTTPVILAAIGTLGWLILCSRQMDALWVAGGWLLGAAALLAFEKHGRRQRYLELAMLLLAFSAIRWFFVSALEPRVDSAWQATESLPLLNWQMATAVAIALGGWWAMRCMRSQQHQDQSAESAVHRTQSTWIVQLALVICTVFMLIAMSFEIDRAVTRIATTTDVTWSLGHMQQLMLTFLWTFGSFTLGLMGLSVFRQSRSGSEVVVKHDHVLLRCAWGILLACTIKWVVVDTLLWTVDHSGNVPIDILPIVNVQLLVGLAIAGAAIVLLVITSSCRDSDSHSTESPMPWTFLASWIPVAVSFVILWGLSFEIDRILAGVGVLPWPQWQALVLWWALLWGVGGLVMMAYGVGRSVPPMRNTGWAVTAISSFAWLLPGTLLGRVVDGVMPVSHILNLQSSIGFALAGLLGIGVWLVMRYKPARLPTTLTSISLVLIGAIGWWLGSLEIDRYFDSNTMGKHMGLSMYWMLYGVLLVLLGFARNVSACRYVGLGLLTMTVVKVLIIDLSTIDQIWRVISFIVSGLLLIATSVAYRKFASRLPSGTQQTPQVS